MLVDGRMVSGKSKNLNTWVRVLGNIETTQKEESKLSKLMKEKIEEARSFEKKVKELRANVGKNKASRTSSPTLEEAEKLVDEADKNLAEFELGSNKTYLEGVVAGVKNRLSSIQKDKQIEFKTLQGHLEFFKRTPLDLTKEMEPLIEKETRATDFLKKI